MMAEEGSMFANLRIGARLYRLIGAFALAMTAFGGLALYTLSQVAGAPITLKALGARFRLENEVEPAGSTRSGVERASAREAHTAVRVNRAPAPHRV